MITFRDFVEKKPKLTMFGLAWAVTWRFWVLYFLTFIAFYLIAVIIAGVGAIFI